MSKSLDEIIKKLPPERQKKIELRSQELISEYKTLQHLKKARKLTIESIANLLQIELNDVVEMERHSDLLLSTLRHYVNTMGGELKLVVEFPDCATVNITEILELNDEEISNKNLENNVC